ncbi:MAG: sulfatase-like hydrolase/transferase [Verrucomicrobiota bacterium JB024]|nr:sulfatase-like hydrolase/transferase [Verrucomicrobiota bacterium JB024]
MKHPNIILCMCDQLRWCETGCYGHPSIRTPHIDRLAGNGVRFETAVSNTPLCMPARSTVLAGQYSRTCTGRLTNTNWSLADGGGVMPSWPESGRTVLPQATLPECLQGQGYRTMAIGKWHIEAWPDKIGFDHYVIPANQHAYTAQRFCEDGGPVFSPDGFSVNYERQRVEEFLNAQQGEEQPFFLYYNISPPHMPLADAPERYTRMYNRGDVVVRPNVDLSRPIENQHKRFLTYLWDYRYYRDHLPYTENLPDEFDLLDLHAMYMGLTSWVDDMLGAVMAELTRCGLAEETIVVFTSDHGDNLGSHGLMGKGSLNEESIRVPMVFAGPGIKTATVSQQIVGLVDLAPTLLELAGAQAPAHMQGRSLAASLCGKEDGESPPVFIETEAHGIAVRTLDSLLALPWATPRHLGSRPHQFYQLKGDPYELQNRSEPLAPEADRLEKLLRDYDKNTPWLS